MPECSPNDALPLRLEDLDTPVVLIERSVLQANIARMQQLADLHGVSLRPHVKTHKSIALARAQLAAGARGIAVAKLSEAETFVGHGFSDIQTANQVVGRAKIERLAELSERANVSCAVDSEENLRDIAEVFASCHIVANLFIEVDTGLHRCGVISFDEVRRLARSISSSRGVRLAGLLTHAGHAYAAQSQDEIRRIARDEGENLVRLAQHLRRDGFDVPVVSVGSTPTATHVVEVPGITELRVGNYIFNDMIQVALGVATVDQCALSILCQVTSSQPSHAVVDAGSKILSSDRGAHGLKLMSGSGYLATGEGQVDRLSEEHGIIKASDNRRFAVGEKVRIIPNHACPVMNLAAYAYVVDGDRVCERIAIEARSQVT